MKLQKYFKKSISLKNFFLETTKDVFLALIKAYFYCLSKDLLIFDQKEMSKSIRAIIVELNQRQFEKVILKDFKNSFFNE